MYAASLTPGALAIRQSDCGPRLRIRLSLKLWEVFWRHLLRWSLGPLHETRTKCQKELAWVKLFEVGPWTRWRRFKYCVLVQLRVLSFTFYSSVLWQMSELGFESPGMKKCFSVRSHVHKSVALCCFYCSLLHMDKMFLLTNLCELNTLGFIFTILCNVCSNVGR